MVTWPKFKRLTRHKQKVVLAAMLEANTNHTTLLKNQSANKISPLNAFPLKFQVEDNFYLLCKFLASARF